MNRLPLPWNCTHACVTRWNEHLLWLSASSHRPPAAKHWNRSHVGQTSMTNGNLENQGGIMQFWQINVPTYSDMFPSPNHVSSNVQTIACMECAARTSCPFYSFIYFCFSFICRTNNRQSGHGATRALCFIKHGLGTCRSYYVTPTVSLKVVPAGFRCKSFTQ